MNIIELFTRLELRRDAISGHSANDIIRIEKQLNVERKLNPDIDTNTAANLISALRDYPRALQMVLSIRHLYNFFTGKDLARKAFPEYLPDVSEEEVRAFISRFLSDDLELRLDQALTNERFSTIRDFLTVKQYLPEESLHRLEKRVTGKLEFGIGRMQREGAIDTSAIQYMRLMSFYEVLSNFRSIELDDKIRIVINRTSDMYNSRREAQFASDVMVCLPSYNAFDDELNRVTQGNSKIINGATLSRSSSSSGSGMSGRVVFLVIILIIKVIIFSSKCSNDNSSSYGVGNSGYEPYGYTYDMRQGDVQASENLDYLAAFDRDSVTEIKSVDTLKTGQNPFKSSLVRRIPINYKSNEKPADVTFSNDSPYDLILLEYGGVIQVNAPEDAHFIKSGEKLTLTLLTTGEVRDEFTFYFGNKLASFKSSGTELTRRDSLPEVRFRKPAPYSREILNKRFKFVKDVTISKTGGQLKISSPGMEAVTDTLQKPDEFVF